MSNATSHSSWSSRVLRRALQSVLVLWIAYTVTFALLYVVPSDPIEARLNSPENPIPAEDAERIRDYYGLDRPIWAQYLSAVGRLLRGDLGYSLVEGTAVAGRIAGALPSTLQLAGLSLVLATALALALVSVISLTRWQWLARSLELLPSLFVSVPMFWLGLLAISVFSFRLGWFNVIDDTSVGSLLVASLALALPISAPLAQVFGASVQGVYRESFVTVLRTRALTEPVIYLRHVVRNASMPLLTVLGLTIGELLAGAVVTETIFARAGVGSLVEQAVTNQDLPMIQGIVLLAATGFVVTTWLIDAIHPLVDPRQRSRRVVGTAPDLLERSPA